MDLPEHQLSVPQPGHAGPQPRGEDGAGQEAEDHQAWQHQAGQDTLEDGQTGTGTYTVHRVRGDEPVCLLTAPVFFAGSGS